ncbi:MAG: helix-turn-helix domain-containing protein [Lachnospiraceae bacterium]
MVEKIKELCKKNKITIAKLEREMKLSNNSISKWDIKKPSYDKVIAVAKYFNVKIGEIIGEEVPENKEEQDLINYYRGSSELGKKNIIHIAKMEYEENRDIEQEGKKSG